MSGDQGVQRSQSDAELEREILEGRRFTLEEAVARMVGPGAMKGESPVARMRQAEIEIGAWLRNHVVDSAGAFTVVLHRRVSGSELMLNNFEQPLAVLAGCCRQLLDSDYQLQELVREADVEWGRVMGERPYFEKQGAPRHPDDPYTVESAREALSEILRKLTESER
jgi:hypothetical protein